MKTKLFLIFLIATQACFAQKKRDIIKIEPISQIVSDAHRANKLPLGFSLQMRNGMIKKTKGAALGGYSWKKLRVNTENARFENGQLSYNRGWLWRDGGSIKVQVQSIKTPSTNMNFEIQLPEIKSVSIHPSKKHPNYDETLLIETHVELQNGEIIKLDWEEAKYLFSVEKSDLVSVYENQITFNTNLVLDEVPIVYSTMFGQQDTLFIKVDYRVNLKFNFDGRKGQTGGNGHYGSNGSRTNYNANYVAIDGDNGSAGFNGQDGEPGTRAISQFFGSGSFLHLNRVGIPHQ